MLFGELCVSNNLFAKREEITGIDNYVGRKHDVLLLPWRTQYNSNQLRRNN